EFNADMNEFHFVYPEGSLLIRHCPICGGRGPASRRSSLFSEVPDVEKGRLFSLIGTLSTVDELIRNLGPAEADFRYSATGESQEWKRSWGTQGPRRTLRYSRISEAAIVDVQISEDGNVLAVLVRGKYIGPALR